MYKYRITKYNPIFRNSAGIYIKDEWTSVCDVINFPDKYNLKDYIRIENEYIRMVDILIKHLQCSDIRFIQFEEIFSRQEIQEYQEKHFIQEDKHILKTYNRVCENMAVNNIKEINDLVRMILREYLWGIIKLGNNKIEFGYDYYMYFVTENACFDFLKEKCSNNVFVEKC